MMISMSIVSARNITYAYPQAAVPAVRDASLSLAAGSYTALVGLNGSGKSTLARILCGLLDADSGSVSFAQGARAAMVFQSPKDQIVCSIVSRDTAFGPQNLGLSAAEVELRTIESLMVTGLLHKAGAQSMSLSLGQTQKEAVAGIIALNPQFLILDEAVSMLDPASRVDIYRFLSYWAERGNVVLHITHDIDAMREAHDIIAMREGSVIFTGTQADFFGDKTLCAAIVGEEINKTAAVDAAVGAAEEINNCETASGEINKIADNKINKFAAAGINKTAPDEINKIASTKINNYYFDGATIGATAGDVATTGAAKKEIAFSMERVDFSYGENRVLNDINFSLRRGELTALTGVSGSGKSTLLELAAGLLAPSSGEFFCASRPALCQQNSDAALFERFAADDVAFGARNRGLSGAALVERVKRAMDSAHIPFDIYAERQTFTLSGGEKRRLAVAGIIALGSDIVLFDEPTAGLDAPSRRTVMTLLRSLADEGRAVLFSTHRMDEAAFADVELTINNGILSVRRGEQYADDIQNASDAINSPIVGNAQSAAAATETQSLAALTPLEGVSLLNLLRRTSANLGGIEKNDGFIARLPPAIKFLAFLALFAASLAVRPLLLCFAMLALSLVYAALAHYPMRKLFSALLKIIPLLLFFCIFQMIFYPAVPGERVFIPYKYFTVTPSKLLLCLKTLVHTEAAMTCILAFSYTTPESDIADGLSVLLKPLALARFPVRHAVVMVEIIFRFMPLLVDEAAGIIKTQLVRGGLGKAKGLGAKIRAILPLFVPLVVRTIQRSEALADALTVRGFK